MSLRVDLEVASPDLRVGVRVKASTLEKALLPTGTVRLLEFYFRGSVSVRAELRDEFPFVSTVSGSALHNAVAWLPQPAVTPIVRPTHIYLQATDTTLRSSLRYQQSSWLLRRPLADDEGVCVFSRLGAVRCGTISERFPIVAAAATATVPRGQAFVAFDYPPDVQVKLEQWGLDALTLGAVPAAVDEWARIALQQALAPYVMPG